MNKQCAHTKWPLKCMYVMLHAPILQIYKILTCKIVIDLSVCLTVWCSGSFQLVVWFFLTQLLHYCEKKRCKRIGLKWQPAGSFAYLILNFLLKNKRVKLYKTFRSSSKRWWNLWMKRCMQSHDHRKSHLSSLSQKEIWNSSWMLCTLWHLKLMIIIFCFFSCSSGSPDGTLCNTGNITSCNSFWSASCS